MRKKLNKNSFIQILGILLILSSLSYLGYYKYRVISRKNNIEQRKEEFLKESVAKNIKNNKNIDDKNNKVLVDNLVGMDSSKSKKNNKNLDENLDTVAFIEIKKLGVILPVFSGTSNKELREGVGVVESTDYPSDELSTVSVIAGHRGGYNGEQTFLNIDKLNNNDEIKITLRGQELTYRVYQEKIIESNDWSEFTKEDDKSKLILLSCHPYPQNHQRILTISKLVSKKEL